MSNAVCAACNHPIDPAAKICPYCGANPTTGEKVLDTQAVLQEVFKPREVTTSESVMEFARQRQGIVIAAGAIILFLVLAGLHAIVTARNARAANAPAVALTDIADLSNQPEENKAQPMPDLDFQSDGRPQAMQTLIVEQGAVTPPEVIAAQQQAQQPQQAQPLQQAAQAPQNGPKPVPTSTASTAATATH